MGDHDLVNKIRVLIELSDDEFLSMLRCDRIKNEAEEFRCRDNKLYSER